MISRRTALVLAECYTKAFVRQFEREVNWIDAMRHEDDGRYLAIDAAYLYDYLFVLNYDMDFLEAVRSAGSSGKLRHFIMSLHTGESVRQFTPDMCAGESDEIGQRYLFRLAQDMLISEPKVYFQPTWRKCRNELVLSLELDGYSVQDSRLLYSEESVLDEQEERGILGELVKELGLANQETGLQHLERSADNFVAERWDDSIGQSRKFLEYALREGAAKHHMIEHGIPIRPEVYQDVGTVPKYLRKAGLITDKEKAAIGINYGLLSETGAHPYMASRDQARLAGHLALTFAQFVLLRLREYLKKRS